ncbi:hypothetical protein M405DRAFT_936477 [Rhizopogon salebrosus TDB-379]|nr:hypothetical protein M405DRAFT_936477 [Rhizopogon salebrosus TDB-379]
MSAASTGLQTVHVSSSLPNQYSGYSRLDALDTVGAMAVAIYDYCLTTAPEVQLIWGRRWNVIRVTFTLARYVPFIVVVMNTYAAVANRSKSESCDTYESVSNAFHMISIIAAEGLLIFCTYAFWQQSKKVLIWLLILAAICTTGSVGVTKAVDRLNPRTNTAGCVLESGKSIAMQYAFLILFELVLVILTVYKRFHFYEDLHSRLVTTLYRDELVYMACVIMASVANIFVGLFAPVRLCAPRSAEHANTHPSDVVHCHYGGTTTRHTRGASFTYLIQSASKP